MLKPIGIAVALFLAYGAQVFLGRHWYFAEIKPADFSKPHNFVEREIETIYYEPGKLGEVLPQVCRCGVTCFSECRCLHRPPAVARWIQAVSREERLDI